MLGARYWHFCPNFPILTFCVYNFSKIGRIKNNLQSIPDNAYDRNLNTISKRSDLENSCTWMNASKWHDLVLPSLDFGNVVVIRTLKNGITSDTMLGSLPVNKVLCLPAQCIIAFLRHWILV